MTQPGAKGLEVELDITLGGRLAAALSQRCLAQFSERAIKTMVVVSTMWMRRPGETKSEARRMVTAKTGLERMQMTDHRPKQVFGQFGIVRPIGVREGVFVWRRSTAQGRKRAGVQAQSVTHVVETQAVSQLRIEQTDDVAPRTKGEGVIFDAGLAHQLRHQMQRNEVAKLAQQRKLVGRWLEWCLFFHAFPCGKTQTCKPTYFFSSTFKPVGQQ